MHNTGYLPMRGNTLRTSTVQTGTKPNLNEAFFVKRELAPDHPDVLANRRYRGLNRWPDLPGFRDVILDYNQAMERLVQKMVRIYARALDLPAQYFDAAFQDPQYSLRMPPASAPTVNPPDRSVPFSPSTRARCPLSAKAVISNASAAGAVIAVAIP